MSVVRAAGRAPAPALAPLLALALGLALAGCPAEQEPPPADAPGDTAPDASADTSAPAPTPSDSPAAERSADTATEPPPAPPPDTALQASEREEEGVVGTTGTAEAPTVILRLEDRSPLGLTGTLARELRRLSGARVRIRGRDAATPVGPGLEVADYEILEIEGEAPLVGILQRAGGLWRLRIDDRESRTLEGLPEQGLAEGMKIWVIGEEVEGGRFRVVSHGVVAPMG